MKQFKVQFYGEFESTNGVKVESGTTWSVEAPNQLEAEAGIYHSLPGLWTPLGPVVTWGIREEKSELL